jgi:hypothetical protein
MNSRPSIYDLRAEVKSKFRSSGLQWRDFNRSANQIIIFGSHALGSQTAKSDLDLLCIGRGKPYKSRYLHLIWIPKSRLRSSRWLGSELATHIAAYGLWIKGANTWAISSRPSKEAILRKRARILARCDALNSYWSELLPIYQEKQLNRLRRDLQRYILMRRGLPSSPAPELDKQWQTKRFRRSWPLLLREIPDVAPKVQGVINLVSSNIRKAAALHSRD